MPLIIVHCARFRTIPSTITSVAAGIYGRNMWFQSGYFPQLELGSFRVAEYFFMYLREARSFQKREKASCKTMSPAAMCLSWKKSNDKRFNLKRKMQGRYPLSNQAQINFFYSLQGVWSVKYFCLLEGFNVRRQSMSKSQDNIETSQ